MLQVERIKPILPSQLLCPNYRGKTAAKGGRSLSKNSPELQIFLAVSLVELMPACDYLGYCIYGKVTHEAGLDTSEFVSKITEILKSSDG